MTEKEKTKLTSNDTKTEDACSEINDASSAYKLLRKEIVKKLNKQGFDISKKDFCYKKDKIRLIDTANDDKKMAAYVMPRYKLSQILDDWKINDKSLLKTFTYYDEKEDEASLKKFIKATKSFLKEQERYNPPVKEQEEELEF